MPMLYYALMFLVVGLIAGALALFGIAAIAGQIAWVLDCCPLDQRAPGASLTGVPIPALT